MRVMFLRMRTVAIVLAAAIAFTVWAYYARPPFLTAMAAKREIPIYSVERPYKTASLSFDAAWGNEDTPILIEILARYNIKATFFVVGDWVRKYPESVKQLHDAGHEIMSHSNKHSHMTQLSSSRILQDLEACNDAIAAVTGVVPTLFRCPYGEYDDKVVLAAREAGMETVQWDVDSLDWQDKTADQIKSRVLGKVGKGSIILFHNAAKNTPAALPGIIEALLQDGYSLVPISELIHHGPFTVDHTGRQFPSQAAPSPSPAPAVCAECGGACAEPGCAGTGKCLCEH